MLSAWGGLLGALSDPSGDRLRRAAEIAVACSLVTILAMTFETPLPALSTYLIFFAAKDNAGESIVTSVVFIGAAALTIGLLFPLTSLTADDEGVRLFVILALAFSFFFLAAASKLAPLAGTLGQIFAYALYELQGLPSGELSVRGLLYMMLVVGIPMGMFIVYNMAIGRRPDALVLQGVASRLRSVASGLRGGPVPSLAGGNARLLGAVRMARLFRYRPPDAVARLEELVVLSYAAMVTAAALLRDTDAVDSRGALADRADRLAAALEREAAPVPSTRPAPASDGLEGALSDVFEGLERVAGGGSGGRPALEPGKPKSGFFSKDAFSSPDPTWHGLKGTLAVAICYLTVSLLRWPGIATCLVTCFIVGLPTLGETAQKLTLRIAGCLVGASTGLLAIVFVLPDTTSITVLVMVVLVVTLPAAWIAVGSPAISYVGFQIAFAAYLCILQGSEPKFDLTEARDRVIGILFGDVVTFMVFANIRPVSILARLKGDVVALVGGLGDVLEAASAGRVAIVRATAISDDEAKLDKVGAEAAAYGFELLGSRGDRRTQRVVRVALSSLRGLADDVARVGAYPLPAGDADAVSAWKRDCDGLRKRLGALVSQMDGSPAEIVEEPGSRPDPGSPRTGRAGALDAVRNSADSVSAVLHRYGRLLRAEDNAHE